MRIFSEAPKHCDFCSSGYSSGVGGYVNLEEHHLIKSAFTASSSKRIISKVFKCERCLLIQLKQTFLRGDILYAYQEAPETSHNLESKNRMNSFERQVRKFGEIIESLSGGNLLDIGCAEGSFLRYVQNLDLKVFGVEPSIALARIARDDYNLNVLEGDAASATQFGINFQIISMWDVLEHVESPYQTFQQISDLLDANGILILNLPMIDTFPAKMLGRHWPFYLEVHLYYFSMKTINQYTEKFSFELIYQNRFWQTLSLRYLIESRWHIKANWIPKISIKYYLGQRTLVFKKTKVFA